VSVNNIVTLHLLAPERVRLFMQECEGVDGGFGITFFVLVELNNIVATVDD